MEGNDIIKCEQLTKRFYRRDALKNISIHIEANKLTGIIGRNGAGKTTFLKIIAGFLKSTSGAVSVFGKEPFNQRMISSNLIFVDDEMAFPETLN